MTIDGDIPIDGAKFSFRRWEKRNKIDFYWVMLLMYTIWEYWNFCDT